MEALGQMEALRDDAMNRMVNKSLHDIVGTLSKEHKTLNKKIQRGFDLGTKTTPSSCPFFKMISTIGGLSREPRLRRN